MTRPADGLRVGDQVDGFQSGVFGRDSYERRRVEAVGADWVVTRSEYGKAEFAEGSDLRFITIGPEDPVDP